MMRAYRLSMVYPLVSPSSMSFLHARPRTPPRGPDLEPPAERFPSLATESDVTAGRHEPSAQICLRVRGVERPPFSDFTAFSVSV